MSSDQIFLTSDQIFLDTGGGSELLVVVLQSLVLGSVVLLLVAGGLSRHGSAVHLWLEGSWWLVATTSSLGLFVSGIFDLIVSQGGVNGGVMTLKIVEICELAAYLALAGFANFGRTRQGRRYAFIRIAFFVATIFVILLWSISSLLDIVTSGWATPGAIITLAGMILTAVIMIADKCVIYWNHIDPFVNARVPTLTTATDQPQPTRWWAFRSLVRVEGDAERQPLLVNTRVGASSPRSGDVK